MAVDEAAATPEEIAAEIHRQLGAIVGSVPVSDIARALDILEIREQPLRSFEAMLLTEPQRDFGHVLLNSQSNRQRRRYSLAHELGHFLCSWHRPTRPQGFACNRGDMASPTGGADHVRQEREANTFAIELLAPSRLVAPYLKRLPDLEVVLALHKLLDISKIAAARRYVSLHGQALAVVVAKDNAFRYVERSTSFPFLKFERDDRLPETPTVERGHSMSTMIDADQADWRLATPGSTLFVQALEQEEGHSLILLQLESENETTNP